MRNSLLRALSPLVAPCARLCACAGLATAISSGPALGQELLGQWDPATLSAGTHVPAYVSPNGNNLFPGTVPQLPKRTIDGVLTDPFFVARIGQAGFLVTINVAPGTYDSTLAGGGEVFPLRIPAHGVSLESWTEGSSGPLDRPVLDVGGAVTGIFVDRIGDNTMPPSVVQGLWILRGFPAIEVDPAGPPFEPREPIPVSCEIRGNRITSSPLGLRLNTQPYLTSLYVVEDNYVGGPEPFAIGGLIGGTGIEETCGEVPPGSEIPEGSAGASTLYRSNRIHLYEIGLLIRNVGAKGDAIACVPRIFSNFIQFCEWLVRIFDCDTFLINNTLAFAVNYSGNPLAESLHVSGGSIEYHNNIVWSPDTAAGPFFGASTPIDEVFIGPPAFPTLPTTNLVFDISPGTPPNFVDGNTPTGVPTFPADLHLTAASGACIGAGTNGLTLDDTPAGAAVTVRSALVLTAPGGSTRLVRTDINLDNDLDPRILNSGSPFEAGAPVPLVDIGGDEFKDSVDIGDGLPPVIDGRIETVARDDTAPATQDEYGNVIQQPGSTFTWEADLFLQGPANGLFVMLAGFGFFSTVTDPVFLLPTQNTSIYQNTFFDGLGWGCFALGTDPTTLNLGFGVFDGNGLFTDPSTGNPYWPITFSFTTAPFEESEIFVQMLVIDATSRTAFSNRKRLELNVGP